MNGNNCGSNTTFTIRFYFFKKKVKPMIHTNLAYASIFTHSIPISVSFFLRWQFIFNKSFFCSVVPFEKLPFVAVNSLLVFFKQMIYITSRISFIDEFSSVRIFWGPKRKSNYYSRAWLRFSSYTHERSVSDEWELRIIFVITKTVVPWWNFHPYMRRDEYSYNNTRCVHMK